MKRQVKIFTGVLIALLVLTVSLLIYIATGKGVWLVQTSYLQSENQIYIMETGILHSLQEFRDGKDYLIKYEFDHTDYSILLDKYDIEKTAGTGTEFEKALLLMSEYTERLEHASDYDNHIDMNAVALLEYSLDKKSHGINCRAKAQILNEMCLALDIYARKVWINPNSIYDNECHVVNEVWDSEQNKWIMLDITNNTYWVDKNGTPLSILEIRDCLANQIFCTPVSPDDNLENLEKSLNKNCENFLYVAKNVAYSYYCTEYTIGETENYYLLIPEALEPNKAVMLISREAVEKSPIQ